ncbi:hypothetical protein P152DRAFT_455477 [Eremomyces bilateralis CBS 781.70]|uniref:Uncharacterized protein n=1 Tax=Eremomyces bilateralis CBS 781.70 TaxID=1392243 RepID=A0A6G1GCY8_9PEZI|nr:uncharacterized protein P152DRAFT_455477 [Eremomyces bilateralis CBS 781.70]KAF1815761.1 hypothetical protein P152DRAFT_455477 [Eremomyces bilateralis CBS 781.70]
MMAGRFETIGMGLVILSWALLTLKLSEIWLVCLDWLFKFLLIIVSAVSETKGTVYLRRQASQSRWHTSIRFLCDVRVTLLKD